MIAYRLKLLAFFIFAGVSVCSAENGAQFEKIRQLMRVASVQKNSDVILITFSYDRPLQLHAFLESVAKRVKGLNQTHVIYRASSSAFASAYYELERVYPDVQFIEQREAMPSIKPHLQKILEESQDSYLMFGVDDIVVTEEIDLQDCVRAMEEHDAYSFYLRLGKNITQCYTLSIHQDFPNPPLQEVEKGIFSWAFGQGQYDWNYPNSMDMTIFRKSDVITELLTLDYLTPNYLDAAWSRHVNPAFKGLCYEHSKMVNIPLNLVQENKEMRNMQFFSTTELLDEFNIGFKIDIDDLYKFNNNSPHMHYIPKFVYDVERMKLHVAK